MGVKRRTVDVILPKARTAEEYSFRIITIYTCARDVVWPRYNLNVEVIWQISVDVCRVTAVAAAAAAAAAAATIATTAGRGEISAAGSRLPPERAIMGVGRASTVPYIRTGLRGDLWVEPCVVVCAHRFEILLYRFPNNYITGQGPRGETLIWNANQTEITNSEEE